MLAQPTHHSETALKVTEQPILLMPYGRRKFAATIPCNRSCLASARNTALVRIGGLHNAHVLPLELLIIRPSLAHWRVIPQPNALRTAQIMFDQSWKTYSNVDLESIMDSACPTDLQKRQKLQHGRDSTMVIN